MTYLLAILAVTTLLQINSKGFWAAWTYTFFVLSHDILIYAYEVMSIDGWTYFLSAAVCDALIIGVLFNLSRKTFLTGFLIIISIMSIFVNGMAFILWLDDLYPQFNTYAHLMLYSSSIIAMMINFNGRVKNSWLYHSIFSPAHKRNFSIQNLDSKKTL